MEKFQIPFNKPYFSGNEIDYIREAIDKAHLSGDGDFTKKCSAFLEKLTGAPKALLTTSCTHALEISALLLDIKDGDEFILPSFTFVSTANAFALRGAKPVFVDVHPETLNINEDLIEEKITPRTKAILPVHYAGVSCEMDTISEIARRHSLAVIEDNAQGLFGKYNGSPMGTFGEMSALSFHETKNIQCGEGGALIINDEKFIERAEIIREKGTNRSRFFRGQVDKYSWVELGSSYLPSDMLAAFLWAQFEKSTEIQAKRGVIWKKYANGLKDWAASNGVGLPQIPDHCEQPNHLFYLILPSFDHQQALIRFLKESGIQAVFHYLPLHLSDVGIKFGGKKGDCPVTENLAERLVRLPLYCDLAEGQQDFVINQICQFQFANN
jgi:dTDP-4-amino-4,6-dideoxygalactose transaminase